MKLVLAIVLGLLSSVASAYDVNGVGLGSKELDVKKTFPSVHCKELEWRTDAADRRCDDAHIVVGGVEAKVTYYLKAGIIRGFDLRFDVKDLEKMKSLLIARWGQPMTQVTETIGARKKDQKDRQVFKMRWEKSGDRALLAAQLEKKRVTVEVERGNFFQEIYKVK